VSPLVAVRRWVVPLAVGVGVGVLGASAVRPAAQAPLKKEDPPFRGLDANLYVQTAAEYRACCYQAYTLAALRLEQRVKDRPAGGKPPAVVLDLDETVFDNAAFQSMQLRRGLAYDQGLWEVFEEKGADKVELVPGAKAFLTRAKALGVAAVYITNRDEKHRAGTRAVLDRHGIAVPDAQLLLASKTSDKTERRAKAREAFDVLLLVGDNLRDFDETFKYDPQDGIAGRKEAVDGLRDKFGAEWIILPNPAYGEWQKPLGRGAADVELLGPAFQP
jgi:acid phosphatase